MNINCSLEFPRKSKVLFVEATSNDAKEVAEGILRGREEIKAVRKKEEYLEVLEVLPEGHSVAFLNLVF